MPRAEIRFLLNKTPLALASVGASETLLDYLRLVQRLTGTKEGCAEGDCGACTVLVGRLREGVLTYEPVNACIRFLASLDGCHVVTIEHLRGAEGGLHPVQRAMVDYHGSQCGFCTPGIVMALYALWMADPSPSEPAIETALQGNLCRCTGYAPIIRAAQAVKGDPALDPLRVQRAQVVSCLENMRDGARVDTGGEDRALIPADGDDLAAVLVAHPDATIIAGATDSGLWVTKHLRSIAPAVFIHGLDDLRRIEEGPAGIRIGAGASYTDCEAMLGRHFPHLLPYWDRIAGWQVRNMGTIGGNIANGSPIGDTPPVLIALGARVVLRRGDARRAMPLEAFFLDYGKQDRAPGEFVEAVELPYAAPDTRHAAYKISKRRHDDISAVAAGFAVRVVEGRVAGARLAFGGMAGTPKRAQHAEAALIGQLWSEDALVKTAAELPKDFTPLTDWRGSAEYRMTVARNLFRRFWAEQEGAA